ncbi:zinc finger protein, putative [Plasmodium chabaudi chabaudi]|uniref:Zinc finger protein, putative n=1 Tax=Plasmodium chabaudi chabaudi TaxID=31271 RepID=A0A1D3LCV3_PLACU|nr:zinc finger protein, putative [Plasmodium chabaudi chabaudi]
MDLSIQENDNWVQCDKCEKWRKLPSNTDISKLTNTWYCSLNGDTRYNSCDIEEEVVISSQYNLNNNNLTNLSNESYKNVDSLENANKFENEFYSNSNNNTYIINNNGINSYQNIIHNEESISQNSNSLNVYINQRDDNFVNPNDETNIISSTFNNKNKYDIKKNKEDKKKSKNKYNTNKKEYKNEILLNNIPLDFGTYSGKGGKSPPKIIKKINNKKKQINSEHNNGFTNIIHDYDDNFYNHNNKYTINMSYSKYSKKNLNRFKRSNSDGEVYRRFKSQANFNTHYYSDTNSNCNFRDNIRMHKRNDNNNTLFYSSMHSIVNNILKKKQKAKKQTSDKNKNDLVASLNSNTHKNSNDVLKKNKKIKEITPIKNEIDIYENYDNKDISIFQNICKDENGNIIGENHSKETNKYIHNMNKIKNSISKKNEMNLEKKKNNDIKINQSHFNQNKTNKSDKNNNATIYNETNLNSNSYTSDNVLINNNHMDNDNNKNDLEKNTSPLNNVVNWVQCENCKKWRKVDAHVNVTQLPDEWYCSLNFWNKYNNCDAEEEVYVEDNLGHKNINNFEKNINNNILENFPKDKNSKQTKTKGKNVDKYNIKPKNYKNCKNLTNKYEINNIYSNFNNHDDYVEKYCIANNIDYKKLIKNNKIDQQHWNNICAYIKFINSYGNNATSKNVWTLRDRNSIRRSSSYSCYENKTGYLNYEHDQNYLSDSFLQVKISKKKFIQRNRIYNYRNKNSQFFYNHLSDNKSYDIYPYHLYPNKNDMIKFNKTHAANDNKIYEKNDNSKDKLEKINESEDEQSKKGNNSHIQDSETFQNLDHNNTKHGEKAEKAENESKCDTADDSQTNQGDSNKGMWSMFINKFRINKWKGNDTDKNEVEKSDEADANKCNSAVSPKNEKEETNKYTYHNIFECNDSTNDFCNEKKYEIMRNYVLYNRERMGDYLNYDKSNEEAKKKNNNNSDVLENNKENNNDHNINKHMEGEQNNSNPYIYSTKLNSHEEKSNINGDLRIISDSKNDIKYLPGEHYLNNDNLVNTPKNKLLNSSDINYHKFLFSNNNKILTHKSNSFSRLSTNEFVNFSFEEYNDENITITEKEINNNYIKLENEKLYNSYRDDINKLRLESQIKTNDDLNSIHSSDKKKNKILPNYEKFIASVNYFNSLSSHMYYPDELMKTIPMEKMNEVILNHSNNFDINNILMKKQQSYNKNDSRENNANVNSLVNDYLDVIENTKSVQNNNKGGKKISKIIPTKNALKNYIINSNKNDVSLKKNAKQQVQQPKLNTENKNTKNKSNDKNTLKKDLVGGNAGNRKDTERGEKESKREKGDKNEKIEKNENNEYTTFSMRCNENKNIIKELIKNRNNILNTNISKGNVSNRSLSYNDINDEYDGSHIKTTILNAKNLKKHILSSRVIIYSKGASLTFNVEEINKNSIYFYNNEEIDLLNGNNGTEFNSNNTNTATNNSNSTNTNNKSKKNVDDPNKDLQNDIESNNIYFNYAHNINFSDSNNIELNKMKKVVTQVFTYDYKKFVNEISLFNDNIKFQIPNLKYKFKKYTHLDDDKNKGKKKQNYQTQLDNQNNSHSFNDTIKKNNEYSDENSLDGKHSNISDDDEELYDENCKKNKLKLKKKNKNSIDYYKNDDTKNNAIKKKNKGKVTKNNKKINTTNLENNKSFEISDNANFSENYDQDKTQNEIYYSKGKIATNKNILKSEMIINDQVRPEKLKKGNKSQAKHVAKNAKVLSNNENINNGYDSFKIVKKLNSNKIKKVLNNEYDEEDKETYQDPNEYQLELEKLKHEQSIMLNDLNNLSDQVDKKSDILSTDNNMGHVLKSKDKKSSDNNKQKYNYNSESTFIPNEVDGNHGEQSRERKRKYSNNDTMDDKQENKMHKEYKKNKMNITDYNNHISQNEGSSVDDGDSNIYEEEDKSQSDQDIYDNNKNKHKHISKHWNENSYKSKEKRPISSDRKSNSEETNSQTDNYLQDKESKDESSFFIIDTNNRSKRKRCILDDDEEETYDNKKLDYNKEEDDSSDHKKKYYDTKDRDEIYYNKQEKDDYYKDKYYDDKYHQVKRKRSYSNDNSQRNKSHENYFEKEEYGKGKYEDKHYRYKKMHHNNTLNKNEIDKNKYYNRNTNQHNYDYHRNSYSSYSENNDDSDGRYYYNKRSRDDKNRATIESEEHRENFYYNHHKEHHDNRSRDSINDIHNNKIHRSNKSIESERRHKENRYKSYDSTNYKINNHDNDEKESNFNNQHHDQYNKNNNSYYSDKYDRHSINEQDRMNRRFSKKHDFKYEHQNENKYKYGEYEKHNTKYEHNKYGHSNNNSNKYDRYDYHKYNSRNEDRRYDRNEHYRYDKSEHHKYERNGNNYDNKYIHNYEKYPNKYNNSSNRNIINKYEKKIKHDDEELISNNTTAPPNSEEKINTNKTYKSEDNLKSKSNENNYNGHLITDNANNNKDELSKYNGEKHDTEKNSDEKNEKHERNSERDNSDINDYEKKYSDYNKYEKEHYSKGGGKKPFYHPENYYKNKYNENYNDDEYHYKKYKNHDYYYGSGEKHNMNNNYNRNSHFHTYSNKKLINKNYKNYYSHRNSSPRDDIIKNKMRNDKFTNINNSKYGNNIHIKQNRIHKF